MRKNSQALNRSDFSDFQTFSKLSVFDACLRRHHDKMLILGANCSGVDSPNADKYFNLRGVCAQIDLGNVSTYVHLLILFS